MLAVVQKTVLSTFRDEREFGGITRPFIVCLDDREVLKAQQLRNNVELFQHSKMNKTVELSRLISDSVVWKTSYFSIIKNTVFMFLN